MLSELRGRWGSSDTLNRNLFNSCRLSRNSFSKGVVSNFPVGSSSEGVGRGRADGEGREIETILDQNCRDQRTGDPHPWR